MKVEMLVTKQGSPNGIKVNTYRKGDIVDLPDSLYDVFIENKWCKNHVEPVKENPYIPEDYKKRFEEHEKQKRINGAPENKMIDDTPIKKTKKSKDEKEE